MNDIAADLDACDPLAKFASEFYKLVGLIYLDGNSLGLLCKPAEASLNEAIDSWRNRAILGWTDGPNPWFEMSRRAAALLAPILGASADDVMVGQSTTINLHQLLATFHKPGKRIVIDELSFPTDRYAVESHLRLRGQDPAADLIVVPRSNELIIVDDVIAALDGTIGLAVLPSVDYRSGQLLNLAELTRRARQQDVPILWDCSHSAGVVDHCFADDGFDFAFGCSYKYLNGGPGSVGWLFVRGAHRECLPALAGWFGSDPRRQFEMTSEFHPAPDAGRFLTGTPHILSLAPVIGALELVNRAGIKNLRQKSLLLTDFLRRVIESKLKKFDIEILTPQHDARRGGHLSLRYRWAGKLSRALRARGVIADFRPPDLLRLAPSPLYTTFDECSKAVSILEDILNSGAYEKLEETDVLVT